VSSGTGALIGYQLGVHVFHIGKQSDVTLRLLPFYTAALLEEAARVAALYWLSRRRDLGDAVTFGVGFARFESIKKALFDLPLSMSLIGAGFASVLCVEIFIFHIALTVLLYSLARGSLSVLQGCNDQRCGPLPCADRFLRHKRGSVIRHHRVRRTHLVSHDANPYRRRLVGSARLPHAYSGTFPSRGGAEGLSVYYNDQDGQDS